MWSAIRRLSIRAGRVAALAAYPPLGAVLRPLGTTDHQGGCFVGDRQGDGSTFWREEAACGVATRAVRLAEWEWKLEQGTAGHGVVKRSRPAVQPVSVADSRLDRPSKPALRCAERGEELIAIWCPQDEHVNIADGSLPGLARVPGGPRSVDVGAGDTPHSLQDLGDDGRNAEGSGQNVRQARVVGAGGVRPGEPGVSHLPRGDQPGLFRPLDLPVDGGIRRASPFCDLGQAEFEVRIPQQECENLALLLGAQDGQQGRARPSIHNLNNTLHFVDS
jgi:hypothetical protein